MDKLASFHRLFTALGIGLGTLGLGLGATHPWHMWLVAAGGAVGAFGGELARMWQPADVKAAKAIVDGMNKDAP